MNSPTTKLNSALKLKKGDLGNCNFEEKTPDLKGGGGGR